MSPQSLLDFAPFAQAPAGVGVYDVMMVVFLLIVGAVGLAGTVLGIQFARRTSELEHTERMKALELGQTLSKDQPFWTPIKLCVAIGVVVPIVVFLGGLSLARQAGAAVEGMWTAVSFIGLAGVVGGTILAAQLRVTTASRADGSIAQAKPAFDPDAYDTVGARDLDGFDRA